MFKKSLYAAAAAAVLLAAPVPAFAITDAQFEALRQEMRSMRDAYEGRISELEGKIEKMANQSARAQAQAQAQAQTQANNLANLEPAAGRTRQIRDNSFNPSIGVILNGKLSSFSERTSEIAGFGVGEEGERGREGLAVDESELNFSANVDDKFNASLTAAIVREDGSDIIELEEAFVETAGGLLPGGVNVKAGRAFWTLGYLNEHHTHTDDFADRPLPYRAFLNKSFNDDGAEASVVLPTPFYSEVGGGIFRGDDNPFGTGDEGINAWSAFARVGGDVGDNASWRAGGYTLMGETDSRLTNEDMVEFIGDTNLYVADVRATWAPTGNPVEKEIIVQGEYFHRDEDGTYEDMDAGSPVTAFDDDSSGWYAQIVGKFHRNWRAGARYSKLNSPGVPAGLVGTALDSGGHDPESKSVMLDWTNSEFSRVRLQANHEELSSGADDTQFILQYIMSIGAHGAHKY